MELTRISTDRIGFRYGAMSSIAMIIYFLIINLLGLEHMEEVRFGSHIFIIIGTVLAIGYYKRSHDGHMQYLPGLGIGFLTGLSASFFYALFIMLYAYLFNPGYETTLRTQDYFGAELSPVMLFGGIALLGVAVGAMTGYIFMMLYDNSGGRD